MPPNVAVPCHRVFTPHPGLKKTSGRLSDRAKLYITPHKCKDVFIYSSDVGTQIVTIHLQPH